MHESPGVAAIVARELESFDRQLDARIELTNALRSAVEERLAAAEIAHFRVETRVKSRESFEAKLRKTPLRKIDDVVGVRVLVFFRSDLAQAEEVMQRMLILDAASYIDKADLLQDSEFGYRSIQFIGRTKEAGWDADTDPDEVIDAGATVEVQIRTMLEHGFAEVEHDIRYKPGDRALPADVHRRFALTAALLEQSDSNLDDIRAMLHLGNDEAPTPRVADIEGWDAARFTRASRVSVELDKRIRTALDLRKGFVAKSAKEVTAAGRLAGWTSFSDYQSGVEQFGILGRRLAIACVDTAHGVTFIDSKPDLMPVGFAGIGLYWTSLAVALGENDLDPFAPHAKISIPDGRLAEFQVVARYLIAHPDVSALAVRDLYRPQAAPAGTTKTSDFRGITLVKEI